VTDSPSAYVMDEVEIEDSPSGAPSQTTKSAFLPPRAFRTSGIVDGKVISVCRIVILGRGAYV
jgi:hypothetical protein